MLHRRRALAALLLAGSLSACDPHAVTPTTPAASTNAVPARSVSPPTVPSAPGGTSAGATPASADAPGTALPLPSCDRLLETYAVSPGDVRVAAVHTLTVASGRRRTARLAAGFGADIVGTPGHLAVGVSAHDPAFRVVTLDALQRPARVLMGDNGNTRTIARVADTVYVGDGRGVLAYDARTGRSSLLRLPVFDQPTVTIDGHDVTFLWPARTSGGLIAAFADAAGQPVVVTSSFWFTSITWPASGRHVLLPGATNAASPTGTGDIALVSADASHTTSTTHVRILSTETLTVATDIDTGIHWGLPGTGALERTPVPTARGVAVHFAWLTKGVPHERVVTVTGGTASTAMERRGAAVRQHAAGCGGRTMLLWGGKTLGTVDRVDLATGTVSRDIAALRPPASSVVRDIAPF